MRAIKEMKAISIIIWILLILCFTIVGGLISYIWVMSNYYNMPQDTTLLVVENVDFSPENFTYFNMTVLNPSNSVTDVNVTAIILRVESRNETYSVEKTEPAIPFVINRGTRQSFKCLENWSNFTGELVRVEPIAAQPATISYPVVAPGGKLNLTSIFDPTESVEYFNLTIENSAAIYSMNFTISEISVFSLNLTRTTPSLPYLLEPNQRQTFQCPLNWDRAKYNVTISVKTTEGYEAAYETEALRTASLYVSDITFNYQHTATFNVTITNSEDATASALISKINLTLQDGTPVQINQTSLPLYPFFTSYLSTNESRTFICYWDWNEHRDENITVSVYTEQSFSVLNMTTKTPPRIAWNMTGTKFDLDDLEHFSVNVTNLPVSLENFTVTMIQIDNQTTTLDPPSALLANGTEVTFTCGFNWTTLRGQDVNISIFTNVGSNISSIVHVPSVGLKFLDKPVFGDLLGMYTNITIVNSNNSRQDVVIKTITFQTNKTLYSIDGTLTSPVLTPSGYLLKIGQNVTINCRWDWRQYSGTLKVTVYTAEGIELSEEWIV